MPVAKKRLYDIDDTFLTKATFEEYLIEKCELENKYPLSLNYL